MPKASTILRICLPFPRRSHVLRVVPSSHKPYFDLNLDSDTDSQVQDYKIPDPLLTDAGHEECRKLNEHLKNEEPLAKQVDVVVCSPMRRTMQTMMEGLECVLARPEVKIEFSADWQENSDAPCDSGSPLAALVQEFPQFEQQLWKVDPLWPATIGAYAFTRTATLARGQAALRKLYNRPEKVIAVVSHSGFLRTAVSQSHYANADYRIFEFAPKIAGKDFQLIEHESTKERGGGMGWSWKGWAHLEESDFPVDAEDEPKEETPPPTPPECFSKQNGRI